MRTEILNDFAELGKYETDNGNSVLDCRGTHVFHIEVLESFNDNHLSIVESEIFNVEHNFNLLMVKPFW